MSFKESATAQTKFNAIILVDDKALRRNQKKTKMPLQASHFLSEEGKAETKTFLENHAKVPRKPAHESQKNIFFSPGHLDSNVDPQFKHLPKDEEGKIYGHVLQSTGIGKRMLGAFLTNLQKSSPSKVILLLS